MWQSRDTHSSSRENFKTATCCWTTADWRMLYPTRKRYFSWSKGKKRCTSKVVGEAKSLLGSNPIPARDAGGVKQNLSTVTQTPQILSQTCIWVFECLLWSPMGLLWGQVFWLQQTWLQQAWITQSMIQALLRRSPLTLP